MLHRVIRLRVLSSYIRSDLKNWHKVTNQKPYLHCLMNRSQNNIILKSSWYYRWVMEYFDHCLLKLPLRDTIGRRLDVGWHFCLSVIFITDWRYCHDRDKCLTVTEWSHEYHYCPRYFVILSAVVAFWHFSGLCLLGKCLDILLALLKYLCIKDRAVAISSSLQLDTCRGKESEDNE